jgi:undecaprenyl-diphosphatase
VTVSAQELALFYAINQGASHPQLDPLMNLLSSTPLWIAIGLGISLWCFYKLRLRFTKIFLLFAFTLATTDLVSYQVLKEHFLRLRPCRELADVRLAAPSCGGQYGLPSNHAANGTAALVLWYLLYRRRKIAIGLSVLVSAVAFSRVYLGVHYPSDVLLGALTGAVIAGIFYTGYSCYASITRGQSTT